MLLNLERAQTFLQDDQVSCEIVIVDRPNPQLVRPFGRNTETTEDYPEIFTMRFENFVEFRKYLMLYGYGRQQISTHRVENFADKCKYKTKWDDLRRDASKFLAISLITLNGEVFPLSTMKINADTSSEWVSFKFPSNWDDVASPIGYREDHSAFIDIGTGFAPETTHITGAYERSVLKRVSEHGLGK